jgi:hypothetical protein
LAPLVQRFILAAVFDVACFSLSLGSCQKSWCFRFFAVTGSATSRFVRLRPAQPEEQ